GILRGPETSASGALSPHDLSGGSAAEPPVGNNYWRSVGDGLFCPLAVATVSGRFSLFAERPPANACVVAGTAAAGPRPPPSPCLALGERVRRPPLPSTGSSAVVEAKGAPCSFSGGVQTARSSIGA